MNKRKNNFSEDTNLLKENKKSKIGILFIAIIIIVCIFILIFKTESSEEKIMMKIGYIMSGKIDDSGWNSEHYNGIKSACDTVGVELLIKEDVKEFSGACVLAIEELKQEGASMIILSSYGYSEEVKDIIKEYPEIVFYANSSEYHDENLTSYFARMYQARYLSGIIAGMMTKNNKIGYVAAMENNEVNRGINAFTLGVKRVNEDAQVIVHWTGTWEDKEKEVTAANTLIKDAQVDTITYHQNRAYVAEVAEKNGVYCIGYHLPPDNPSSTYLTTVKCEWKLIYQELLSELLKGKANLQRNYWIGLEAEAVGLSEYSSLVSNEIKTEVEIAKQEIMSGKAVFSGLIYDTRGEIRCNEGEMISDEVLLEQLDWFVKGIKIYE